MRGGVRNNQSSDFVAEFAAKRAAQLERARQLREERRKPSTPETIPTQDRPPSGSPMTYARSSRDDDGVYRPLSASATLSGDVHHAGYSGRNGDGFSIPTEVMVREDDFRKAVKHGIITPDQARQLWSVLSDPGAERKLDSFKKAQHPTEYNPSRYDGRQGESSSCPPRGHVGGEARKPNPRAPKEWNSDVAYEPAYVEEYHAAPPVTASKKVTGAAYSVRQPPAWNDDSSVTHDDAPPPVKSLAKRMPVTGASRTQASREPPAWNSDFADTGIPYEAPAVRKPAPKVAAPQPGIRPTARTAPQAQAPVPVHVEDKDEVEEFERQKEEQARQFEEALEQADDGAQLAPCRLCGRTFRETILARHEKACAKSNKKRKVYDMTKARLDGIDGAEEVLRQQKRAGKSAPVALEKPAGKLPKWKLQHQQFQAVLKINKGGASALTGPPIPMPEELDDRVPCPHCGRKFAAETAERHIPKCMTTINKPKSLARPIRR